MKQIFLFLLISISILGSEEYFQKENNQFLKLNKWSPILKLEQKYLESESVIIYITDSSNLNTKLKVFTLEDNQLNQYIEKYFKVFTIDKYSSIYPEYLKNYSTDTILLLRNGDIEYEVTKYINIPDFFNILLRFNKKQ